MKQLNHMGLIARKEIKLFFTDRLALLFFLLFPFLFVVMFSFILGDIGSGDERLALHMSTREAEGGLSYQIIDDMESGDDWEIIRMDYENARLAVENKELSGFLAFPPDFSEGLLTGSGTRIEVVADAEAVNDRAALYGLAQAIASRVGSQFVAVSAIGELQGGQPIPPPSADQKIVSEEPLIEFSTETFGEVEPYNANNYLIPGYLVMFVFFAAALSAETIVRERQNNTLERLLATSVTRQSIVGGLFAGTAAKGLIQIAIFWTAGILIFNIDLGLSPAAVVLLSILMVLMSSAFGIMLATLVKTQRSAGSIAVLAALFMAPLGGCWWPLFILPNWMQTLAKITPHGWANNGFNKLMLFGAGFGAVVPEMLAVAGFAVLFGAIALWRFRARAA
jgi:ABC-2 type transport system permease protein